MLTETIAAISTSGNNGGINIIRISGENSLKIAKMIFSNYIELSHQRIVYGKIRSINKDKIIDEVLVSCFKSPNSYTGEDVCEINCHGGRKVTLEILNEVIRCGARLAEPGEFSKRAFLNGKMDLSKAEAVIDLINAKTSAQTEIALNQLEGKLYKKIRQARDKLVEILAQIEVNIDYPEYDYEELGQKQLEKELTDIKTRINKLILSYDNGKYLKEGIDVALIGTTNVGKSSLLNALLEEERAIVTDIAGTTRDVIEDTIILDNLILNVSDTAGIRDTEDVVEMAGISKSLDMLMKTDLIIYMIDSTKEVSKKDIEILNKIKNMNKHFIICLNKVDVSYERENIFKKLKEFDSIVEISALYGTGIERLKQEIKKVFDNDFLEKSQEKIIVNERHKGLLETAQKHILKSLEDIKGGQSVDIVAINIKEIITILGKITGEDASEDVINKIFEKFCLGK